MWRSMDRKALGHRIRALRLAKGWTVPEFARRVERTRQAIEHWESGRRTPPYEELQRIAAAFGLQAEIRLIPATADLDDHAGALLMRLAEVLRRVPEGRRKVLEAQIEELEHRYPPVTDEAGPPNPLR